jgi:putative transposase
LIGAFKTKSTKQINLSMNTPGQSLWQRGFYDRIIRNDKELDRIRKYIVDNPLKWELDPYHPRRRG